MKLELMSMEELSKLIKLGHSDVVREACARELAKRENNNMNQYRRCMIAQPRLLTPYDYL